MGKAIGAILAEYFELDPYSLREGGLVGHYVVGGCCYLITIGWYWWIGSLGLLLRIGGSKLFALIPAEVDCILHVRSDAKEASMQEDTTDAQRQRVSYTPDKAVSVGYSSSPLL